MNEPVCRFLRWKGFYADPGPEATYEDFAKNEVPYSCLKTCQPWGPDDAVAAPESCGSHRACYRAGNVTPRPRGASLG